MQEPWRKRVSTKVPYALHLGRGPGYALYSTNIFNVYRQNEVVFEVPFVMSGAFYSHHGG